MKTYWVSSEGAGILNPGERPFRSLPRVEAFALKAATDCSWTCLTPPGRDNDRDRGNFMCGTLSPHGIHIQTSEDGYWTEEYDVPDEPFQKTKAGPHVDWTLEVVIDRGTDALADGHDVQYFTGPEQTETGWDLILDRIADGDEVVEATVRIAPQGRYTHKTDDYPLVFRPGYGF